MLVTEPVQSQATIVVAGVDTHKDSHHVAVLDLVGRVLADRAFPVTGAGYRQLLDWVAGHGVIESFGIELTDSYGAGLTRYLTGQGVAVLQVTTTDKAARARRGKTDRLDAIAAAQKVLAGLARAIPKDTTGSIESIRMISIVRASAVKDRTRAINQFKALIITAPTELREQLGGLTTATALKLARTFRPDPTRLAVPAVAAKQALKRLAARISELDPEIAAAEKELGRLATAVAPTLIARPCIGPITAAQLLMTASSNITRIHSEAAFARLCGAAPIPVASGKTHRMRLHRGGDRQANYALHMIIIGRLKNDPATKAYRDKKLAKGHSTKDAIRALKRYVAREVFNTLKTDLNLT